MSRVIADVDVFSDGQLMGFTQLFSGVLTILGTLGFMLYLNVPITLVVVVITPLSIFTAAFIATHSEKYFRRQSEIRGEQTALVSEMIEGQRVVRAFGQEKTTWSGSTRSTAASSTPASGRCSTAASQTPSPALSQHGLRRRGHRRGPFAVNGGITVGNLTSFLGYANQYTKPFNEISGVVTELQNALTCAGRLFELLDEAEEVPDGPDALDLAAEESPARWT